MSDGLQKAMYAFLVSRLMVEVELRYTMIVDR